MLNDSAFITASSLPTQLSDFSEVDVSTMASPSDGDVFRYNASESLWKATALPDLLADLVIPANTTDLGDVTSFDLVPPSNGQIMTWNSESGQWYSANNVLNVSELNNDAAYINVEVVPTQVGELFNDKGYLNSNQVVHYIGDLEDVSSALPANGAGLVFNLTNSTAGMWVAGKIQAESLSSISEIDDVQITGGSLVGNNVLKYNETTGKWEPGSIFGTLSLYQLSDVTANPTCLLYTSPSPRDRG